MLTNVFEYGDIYLLTCYIMLSPILSPLAKTAYLAIVYSFLLQVSFFRKMFRSKSQKVETGLKLNVLFTIFVLCLIETHTLQITSLSIEKASRCQQAFSKPCPSIYTMEHPKLIVSNQIEKEESTSIQWDNSLTFCYVF